MSTDTGRLPRAVRLGWLPWVLLAAAWFATMPWRALLDPDEGRYAEIPREMLLSGDWITPRFDDLKYFEKPPLQYWATAATYAVAGVRPWSSRLWAVGLAFACLPLVYAWSRRLYGESAALAALVALAVSPFFVLVGHLNLLDQAFTFWLTAALLAFTYAQLRPPGARAERRWMLTAWACAALAVLSKGIVVGVLAAGALIVYTLLERDTRTWRRLHVGLGSALFLLIAAPWFVLVSVRNPSFPGFFFVHEHFARFLTTVHQRVEPWWFFLPLLLLAVLPWIATLLRAVRASARAGPRHRGAALQAAQVSRGVFRRNAPILFRLRLQARPLHPADAAPARVARRRSGAGLWAPLRTAPRRSGRPWWCSSAQDSSSTARGATTSCPRRRFGGRRAGTAVALVAPAVRLTRTRLSDTLGVLASALAAILAWQFLLCAFTVTPPERSAADLVSAVRPLISAHTPLYSVGQYRETISPYLGRTLQLAGYEGELQFGLAEEPQKRMTLEAVRGALERGGRGRGILRAGGLG